MPDENETTEKKLVTACQRGEAKAQKQLYEQYFGLLLGVSLRYAHERESAVYIFEARRGHQTGVTAILTT